MQLRLLRQGKKRNVYVLVLPGGRSPAFSFLRDLEQTYRASHQTMVRRIDDHANEGPSLNVRHFHVIKTFGNLYVFKTYQGSRLLCFYHLSNSTVLLTGYKKGGPETPEYKKAAGLRDQFLGEE